MPLFGRKKSPEDYMKQGLKHMKRGIYDRAEEAFIQGLKISPSHNELNYLLGITYMRAGEEKKAEHYFELTLERNPHHVEAREELSKIQKNRKELSSPDKKGDIVRANIPVLSGKEWGDVKSQYMEFFSKLKKKEGEKSFDTHMLWQEFAFKYERRKIDSPTFFFFTEKYGKEIASDIFDLILTHASLMKIPQEKKERETLIEQAEWIARNLGNESHITRIQDFLWGD